MLSGERSGLTQRVFRIDRHVFDLESVRLQSNSTSKGPSTGGDRMVLHEGPEVRRKPESCCCPILFPLATVDKRHFGFAAVAVCCCSASVSSFRVCVSSRVRWS